MRFIRALCEASNLIQHFLHRFQIFGLAKCLAFIGQMEGKKALRLIEGLLDALHQSSFNLFKIGLFIAF